MKQLPRNRSLSHADTVYETDHVSEGSCFFMIANKEHLAMASVPVQTLEHTITGTALSASILGAVPE